MHKRRVVRIEPEHFMFSSPNANTNTNTNTRVVRIEPEQFMPYSPNTNLSLIIVRWDIPQFSSETKAATCVKSINPSIHRSFYATPNVVQFSKTTF